MAQSEIQASAGGDGAGYLVTHISPSPRDQYFVQNLTIDVLFTDALDLIY